jgi:tetratricopeptide (TPR) repeat protein
LQGHHAEALALIEEAIVQWDAIGRVVNSSRHRWLLAEAHLLGSRLDDARKAVEEALELARRHGERGNEAEALRVLGECASAGARPDPTTARRSFEQAVVLAEELAMRPLVAHCHLGLTKVYWRTGQRAQARAHLSTAMTMYRDGHALRLSRQRRQLPQPEPCADSAVAPPDQNPRFQSTEARDSAWPVCCRCPKK